MSPFYRELAWLAGAAIITAALAHLAWEVAAQSLPASDRVEVVRSLSTPLLAALVVAWVARRQAAHRFSILQHELKLQSLEAERARALQDVVLNAVPESIVLIGKDRKVLEANQVARRIHASSMVDMPCEKAFAHEDRCMACPGCETLTTKAFAAGSSELSDPRTDEIVTIESHPVRLPDGSEAALLVERVITEQKKLQASLVHQEKMAAFGLVAAGVAHDMGNPLSSIEMHLQLFDEAALSAEDAESVRTLREEAARLRRTLRELVDFARRRRDAATLVSVESVIQDALRLLRYDPRMRQIEVAVDASPDTPPVFVIEDHLMQVILNLLINALDAMANGGRLRIDTRFVDGQISIRVHDSGAGMSRSVLDHCFEPLFTTKALGKGTGLGLSICRDVLKAAGGDIELHSVEGQGTVAIVTLPPALANDGAEPPHESVVVQ